MKRYLGILVVILMSSCSTDRKLAKENAELLQLTKELTLVAEAEKAKAEEAANIALMAQEEAQRQARLAKDAADQARKAQEVAEMNAAEAHRQVDLRFKEVEELKKRLENCK